METETLRQELRTYYRAHDFKWMKTTDPYRIHQEHLNAWADAHPEESPAALKAYAYEYFAETFEPVLFLNSPFYTEMGLRCAEYDGRRELSAGGWLFLRNEHLFGEVSPVDHEHYMEEGRAGFHIIYGPYCDYDHHCFPYTSVLEHGLKGLYEKAESERSKSSDESERDFLTSVMRAMKAVAKIAGKFGAAASELRKKTKDPEQKKFLQCIAETAPEIPWRKPETFYEALQTLWFLHEVCASIEGVGMSVIGHWDRNLGPFYERDVAAGRMTRAEAEKLLALALVYTDCKYDSTLSVDQVYNGQEQGDTLILGGCLADGSGLFNEVTRLILEIHHSEKLIYPKIHLRIRRDTPDELLHRAAADFLSGRNVLSFLNDDAVIPNLVKSGVSLPDARRYVAGGCWEIILEGYEHSAGANCYFNLPKMLELSLCPDAETERKVGFRFQQAVPEESFEGVYRVVMKNVLSVLRRMGMVIGNNGSVIDRVYAAPFFSAGLEDCLLRRRDYTAGGGRYNTHALPMAGLAVFVDALLALKQLCFVRKRCSLAELAGILNNNWAGEDVLCAEARSLPAFGDGNRESTELANRILQDLADGIKDLKNERGGPYRLGIYNYNDIVGWRDRVGALPNGRRRGDFLTQGLTPDRIHDHLTFPDVVRSVSALNLTVCAGATVMTLSVPKEGMTPENFTAMIRSWLSCGAGMLQLNCISRSELEDAKIHPENHRDLIVRLYGYSARFVCLTPLMQEEFISRNFL